jgi:spermidine/putrescine transport system permease protein
MRGPISWWRDPWRKPHALRTFTWLYLIWSLVPVTVAIMFSFNNGRSRSTWQGFSMMWYTGKNLPAGAESVFGAHDLTLAMIQTLKLATLTTIIALPIGVAFAIGLDRWHGRGSGTSNFVMLFSFVMPEMILGLTMFMFFQYLWNKYLQLQIPLGTPQQVIALVTFQVSYPVIIVRARLLSIGRQYEEAAMDLGAPPTKALRRVLLPLLYPAIFASGVLVFADVIDDFITVRYLSDPANAGTEPMSVKIYNAFRGSPTPATNAMATLMLVGTLIAVTIGVLVYRRATKGRGEGGSTIEEFAMSI